MNPPPLPRPDRASRRRLPVWLRLILSTLLVTLVGGVIWFVSYRISNASAIHRLEANAKARGESLTLAEVAATYPDIPAEQNAAVALIKIWQSEDPVFWGAFLAGRRPLPSRATDPVDPQLPIMGAKAQQIPRNEDLPEATLILAQDYLASQRVHMDGVRGALRCPQHRAPITITEGFEALLPHLPVMKREAQNFRLEALVAAQRGNVDLAIASLADAARVGELLKTEPLLVSQLVRIACWNMAIDGMEQLLSRHSLSVAQLARLGVVLDGMKDSQALRKAYISDRATDLDVFSLSGGSYKKMAAIGNGRDGLKGGDLDFAIRFYEVVGLAGADKRLILETYDEAIALAETDTPEALARRRQVFADAARIAESFPPKIISSMLLPALEKVATKFAVLEARRRAAVLAIAVQEYRGSHDGHATEQLDDMAPHLPKTVALDPFDGKPLRYRRNAYGFTIYSVGADGRDNGGLERPSKGTVKEFDETFVVAR